jgi:TolB-like protein/DNA-binding winged helix-turn-helix (wHTH) protein/Flp pilus assembly protein TadD
MPETSAYRFGAFTLDLASHRLLRDGAEVALTPKAFEVLIQLVRERRRVMTKQELLDAVWADTAVTENTLTQRIKEIRQALGDSPDRATYLRSIPRVGYQFVGQVTELSGVTEPVAAAPDRPAGRMRQNVWRRSVMAAVVLAVTGGGVLLLNLRPQERSLPVPSSGRRLMLAVLPFENLSGDPDQEYFSAGLTEEMIAELGRLEPSRLGVIARTSSMAYKGTEKTIGQIAAELGVDYVLEGSVRREADRVRVVAQLIRADDQSHVWAEQYDRELRGVLALQGELARSIAVMARVQLSTVERVDLGEARQVSPEAYQAYLRGRYFLGQRTGDAIQKGLEHFQQAAALEPTWALAQAGLADAYELAGSYAGAVPRETVERAITAARRALELDPTRSEPHTALGTICASYTWQWSQCQQSFQRALAINASDALAHKGFSEVLSFLGRHDEAIEHARLAVELDPLSLIAQSNLGISLYRARRFDQSLTQMRQVIDLDPNYMLGHFNLGLVLAATGAAEDAIRALQRARELASTFPDSLALLGYVYGQTGRIDDARETARALTMLEGTQYVSPYSRATLYLGLGDRGRALGELERAFTDRSWLMALLKVDPLWDPLRAEPRFQRLLREMNYPE